MEACSEEIPRGDGTPGFVTVIVDLTLQVDGIGLARLLDMVPGRSADAFGDWLADRPQRFRDLGRRP